MELSFSLQPYYYDLYKEQIDSAKNIGKELNEYLSGKSYATDLKLDRIELIFINTQGMKCRVRPYYIGISNLKDPIEFNVMTLFYEIPMPEKEFVQVSDEDRPTYMAKALLEVLEAQNAPVKIRKQFDRERFIADVRDFFVNVKGCKL
jgi:hypothetical protein